MKKKDVCNTFLMDSNRLLNFMNNDYKMTL